MRACSHDGSRAWVLVLALVAALQGKTALTSRARSTPPASGTGLADMERLADVLMHLQLHYFPTSGQVTVVTPHSQEASDWHYQRLRQLSAPRRMLAAEDTIPSLEVHNYLSDLVIVVIGDQGWVLHCDVVRYTYRWAARNALFP